MIQCSQRKWTYHKYHRRDRNNMTQKYVKMYFTTTQFTVFPFCSHHAKTHGVQSLSNNYHLQLLPKFVHGKCAIQWIPQICVTCTCKHVGQTMGPWCDPSSETTIATYFQLYIMSCVGHIK